MKLPRASMTTSLFAILVFAVDFGVARDLLTHDREALSAFGLGFLPMATALVFGAYRLARLRGRAGAFTVGFVAVGLAAMAGYMATIRFVPNLADRLGRWFDGLDGKLQAMLPANWSDSEDFVSVFGLMVFLSLPTSLVALAGGWLARRVALGREASARHQRQPRVWKRPRFTLASALILVAVLAVDFAAVHLLAEAVRFGPNQDRPISPWGPWLGFITPWGLATVNRWVLFAIGFSPMANLLFLGLPGVLRARGRPGSFLLGFEAVGWLATIACLTACAVAPESMMRHYQVYGEAVERVIDFVLGSGRTQQFWLNSSRAGLAAAAVLCMAFFTLPPLIAALSAGVISRRIGRREASAA